MRRDWPEHSREQRECVEGPVQGGRSPAKRTLDRGRDATTLKGLGRVAAFRDRSPSPSGGEDFPALGGRVRGGGALRFGKGVRVFSALSTQNDTNPTLLGRLTVPAAIETVADEITRPDLGKLAQGWG